MEYHNRTIAPDLEELESDRYHFVTYDALIDDTRKEIEKLCDFIDIKFDEHLRDVVEKALPHSRHTVSPPLRNKWKKNESEMKPYLPDLDEQWERLLRIRKV